MPGYRLSQHCIIIKYRQEYVAFRKNPGKTLVVRDQCVTMATLPHLPDYISHTGGPVQHQRVLQFQRQHLDFPQAAFNLHNCGIVYMDMSQSQQ